MNITQQTIDDATVEEMIFAAKKIIEGIEQTALTQIQFKICEAARSSIIALELLMFG